MKNLYLDTETTGLPYKPASPRKYGKTHNTNGYPRLVQIAWILTDENDNTLTRHSHVIIPEGFSIPYEATSIHGITTKEAIQKGEPLLKVLHLFNQDLLEADRIIGHNLDFDEGVMSGELRRKGQRKALTKLQSIPEEDTMMSTIDFCAIPFRNNKERYSEEKYKYPKLCELYCKLFGHGFDNAHDAMADIEATRQCHVELHKRNIMRPGSE